MNFNRSIYLYRKNPRASNPEKLTSDLCSVLRLLSLASRKLKQIIVNHAALYPDFKETFNVIIIKRAKRSCFSNFILTIYDTCQNLMLYKSRPHLEIEYNLFRTSNNLHLYSNFVNNVCNSLFSFYLCVKLPSNVTIIYPKNEPFKTQVFTKNTTTKNNLYLLLLF